MGSISSMFGREVNILMFTWWVHGMHYILREKKSDIDNFKYIYTCMVFFNFAYFYMHPANTLKVYVF